MDIVEFFKKFWHILLVALGLGTGGVLYVTGAWGVPQTGGVYASLLPTPQWLYAGASYPCIWEVHPNDTKTINSVSYGTPGSYTSCTQNITDRLLWTCDSVTVAQGTVACQPLRVVQNEFPGTSETLFSQNYTFDTPSPYGTYIPACAGQADCTITNPITLDSGTYIQRNLVIASSVLLSATGNVTIIALENLTITSTGSISFTSVRGSSYTLNITAYRFNHFGAISGDGTPAVGGIVSGCGNPCFYGSGGPLAAGEGANLVISAALVNITGSTSLKGGRGYDAYMCCGGASSSCPSMVGARGGSMVINSSTPDVFVTGPITLTGGAGGNAGACASGALLEGASVGSSGGVLKIRTLNYTASGSVTADGGKGGDGSGYDATHCTAGVAGGNARNQNLTIYGNLTVTGVHSATGGSGGAGYTACPGGSAGANGIWNVSYCGNGTGMDWTKFTPSSVGTMGACMRKPSVSWVNPVTNSNFTAYLQNITANTTLLPAATYYISFSKDNGSSWQILTPSVYVIPFNVTNNTAYLETHRQGSDIARNAKMRVIAYNTTALTYSDPVEVTFNLSDMGTRITQFASPNGTVSTNAVTFFCNYTNSSNYQLQAATAKLYLDGAIYNMSFNNSDSQYYYTNTNSWSAGNHTWYCIMDKADYIAQNGTLSSVFLSGFGVSIASGKTSVNFTCPFPTISGMTPPGQKAGVGVFRIINYNTTSLKNYTIYLNNTPPSGATIYARCDRYVGGSATTGWIPLSTGSGYKCMTNVNSTNNSAYMWLRLDCVSVTPGSYVPVSYAFVEE